tara:strand:- start:341 stop:589 length:249 start_codon:yes stop_codon:yes gene_type:complete
MPNTYTIKKGKSALIRKGPGLGTLKLRRISANSQVVINKVKKLENGIRRGHMIKPVKGWVSMQCLKKSKSKRTIKRRTKRRR